MADVEAVSNLYILKDIHIINSHHWIVIYLIHSSYVS